MQLSTNETVQLLRQAENAEVQAMAADISVVASLTKIFNASLELASDMNQPGGSAATALAKKGLETSKIVQTATQSRGLETVNAGLSISMANTALKGLSNASPAKALTVAGLITVEKMLIVGGLQNKHKCEIAIASLAATGGLTIAAAPTGVGLVVGVIGVLAQGIETYGACKATY